MSDDQPSITPKENGSLVLKGKATFVLPDGSEAEPEEARFLCRCGKSANKPYCDGSHRDAGFSSEKNPKPKGDRLFSYEGKDVTVHFNPLLCSHAAECGKRLLPVFNPEQKPWVQPDNGSVDDIMAVVRACPSGALQAGTPAQHATGDTPKVTIDKDGPYRVENIALADANWSESASRAKYVLCRCGHSQNKPFCDGSHQDAGWKDSD